MHVFESFTVCLQRQLHEVTQLSPKTQLASVFSTKWDIGLSAVRELDGGQLFWFGYPQTETNRVFGSWFQESSSAGAGRWDREWKGGGKKSFLPRDHCGGFTHWRTQGTSMEHTPQTSPARGERARECIYQLSSVLDGGLLLTETSCRHTGGQHHARWKTGHGLWLPGADSWKHFWKGYQLRRYGSSTKAAARDGSFGEEKMFELEPGEVCNNGSLGIGKGALATRESAQMKGSNEAKLGTQSDSRNTSPSER